MFVFASGMDVHFGKSMHVCMTCGKHPNEPSVNANSAVFRRTGLETSIHPPDSKTNYASVTQCVLASLPKLLFPWSGGVTMPDTANATQHWGRDSPTHNHHLVRRRRNNLLGTILRSQGQYTLYKVVSRPNQLTHHHGGTSQDKLNECKLLVCP